MKKPDYKLLYILWAALFALTAGLGLAFPEAEEGAARWMLLAVSVVFFVPPWMILVRAKADGSKKHVRLIRWLSLASILLTAALLCANLMSAGLSDAMGYALHAALTVVSAPMVCSNLYVVPLFLWGTLLAGSIGK